MSFNKNFNDSAILTPEDDLYGIDPFAQALANSIKQITRPEGTVVAVNGPWGSGKSSAINLILYHLRKEVPAEEITIINFACWWFRGEEALSLAFLQELNVALAPTLTEKAKKILPKLGKRVLKMGTAITPLVNVVTGGVGCEIISELAENLSDLIDVDESIENQHRELADALIKQPRKFLVVIDDIDRLSPDEALLVFRLIKSVGGLPNVMYLLAFDRNLADRIVSERFPSEGPHYLEKIIQAAFELPEAVPTDLYNGLLAGIESTCGTPEEEKIVRFMNIFYDVIAPLLRTPRDVMRIMNTLSVTWPAVNGEVDIADFVALESLRIVKPDIYRSLRANKARLCGIESDRHYGRAHDNAAKEYENTLLQHVPEQQREAAKAALMRLFPRLEAVWNNMNYSHDYLSTWQRDRLVCTEEHFDTYFRFSLSENTVSQNLVDELVERANEVEFIKSQFLSSLQERRKNGQTRASLLLHEMNVHADRILQEHVQPFLSALYEIADDLDVSEDEAKGFSIGSNRLRVHWLTNRLLWDRFDLPSRSAIILRACQDAPFGWLVDITSTCFDSYHPRSGREPRPDEKCLTTEDDLNTLMQHAIEKIRAASSDGSLMKHRYALSILFRWREFAGDGGAEVRAWTASKMVDDEFIVQMAEAATSHSWSQGIGFSGLGDKVARRNVKVQLGGLDTLLDVSLFYSRLEELEASKSLSPNENETVDRFLSAWRRQERNLD